MLSDRSRKFVSRVYTQTHRHTDTHTDRWTKRQYICCHQLPQPRQAAQRCTFWRGAHQMVQRCTFWRVSPPNCATVVETSRQCTGLPSPRKETDLHAPVAYCSFDYTLQKFFIWIRKPWSVSKGRLLRRSWRGRSSLFIAHLFISFTVQYEIVSPSVFAETSQASQCGGPQLRLSSTTNFRARYARPQVGNRSR